MRVLMLLSILALIIDQSRSLYSFISQRSNLILNRLISFTSLNSRIKRVNSGDTNTHADQNDQNYRFWTRSLLITKYQNSSNSFVDPNDWSINNVIDQLESVLAQSDIEISRLQTGLAIIHRLNIVVPVHDGMLQSQHITPLPNQINYPNELIDESHPLYNFITFYGFSQRAKHRSISPGEEERPTDPIRLKALIDALPLFCNITADELMSESLAGLPPARIFRSFVSPRLNGNYLLEPVERAANRTAAQIEMALRQVRADQAAYLRNTDKSLLITSTKSLSMHPVALVLDNIRSAFNVGSMFRTAETAGVCELLTCGITAHPPHPKLRKTALNSVDIVPTRHFDDTLQCILALKSEGYKIIAMETTSKSEIYSKVSYPKKVALVLGNEVTGVDPRIMEIADLIVEIPTYGIKNSLNVASAAPVVLFEVLRQWHESSNLVNSQA